MNDKTKEIEKMQSEVGLEYFLNCSIGTFHNFNKYGYLKTFTLVLNYNIPMIMIKTIYSIWAVLITDENQSAETYFYKNVIKQWY